MLPRHFCLRGAAKNEEMKVLDRLFDKRKFKIHNYIFSKFESFATSFVNRSFALLFCNLEFKKLNMTFVLKARAN